jgi:branched-chain amino acid transport system permease protein
MDFPYPVIDRQLQVYQEFDQRIRRKLRLLVSDAVIEEHRCKPLGQHSDALDRLLNYFRRGGMAGKYGLLQSDPGAADYRIVRFSGARGAMSTVEDEPLTGSLNAAYHAVFLRRIADLLAD